MSIARTAGPAGAAVGTDGAFPSQPWETRIARFTAQWGPSAAVITAHGELDAANAGQLADYVQRCAAFSKLLILDLSGLEFFGTAGFSALHTINVRCAKADVQWAVVPSRAVSRLLRICDPEHALPTAESANAALAGQTQPRRLLQLVSQPR
jgi:anti-anti-sigma factor